MSATKSADRRRLAELVLDSATWLVVEPVMPQGKYLKRGNRLFLHRRDPLRKKGSGKCNARGDFGDAAKSGSDAAKKETVLGVTFSVI